MFIFILCLKITLPTEYLALPYCTVVLASALPSCTLPQVLKEWLVWCVKTGESQLHSTVPLLLLHQLQLQLLLAGQIIALASGDVRLASCTRTGNVSALRHHSVLTVFVVSLAPTLQPVEIDIWCASHIGKPRYASAQRFHVQVSYLTTWWLPLVSPTRPARHCHPVRPDRG